ncbi:MAG: DUF4080 domain-containing protein, partial [Tepidisphaeraceae bacterium]
LGVYIWNARQSLELAKKLKSARPQTTLILGGPEVSYESDQQEICSVADYTVTGEADVVFAEVCREVLSGRRPLMKLIASPPPEFAQITLPYDLYDDTDIAHRVVYVEASRGCPFKCEFCLSSLDVPVRNVPLERFLGAMQSLLDRGVKRLKFVDRTFNLNLNFSRSILEFFLERYEPGMFLHFEMVPDRLPDALRAIIRRFPPGALQFEVGVQTFNEEVAALISRRQDNLKLEENLRWLRAQTCVHVHADLIVGLPGEDVASFARGFDRLVGLRPQEIQVGMLKRLRGTPIVRHDREWEMRYQHEPPYEIVSTKVIDAPTMARLKRFARYWDLIANSGNFVETTPLLLHSGAPFDCFLDLSERLFQRFQRAHAIPLIDLSQAVFDDLVERGSDISTVAGTVWRDWARGGRREVPKFLRRFVTDRKPHVVRKVATAPRQARHLSDYTPDPIASST